jgi:predicted phage terminase large subunit-like protein
VTADRDLLLVNVERERFDDTRVGAFVSNAYAGAIRTPVRITVENASSGPKVIRELMTAGYPVASANPDKDKVTRALLAVARYEQHVVYHRRGAVWLSAFEQELLAFPNAAHDDQVDTVSYAAIDLPKITVGRTRRRERRPGEMAGVRTREM